ncbi:ABC transporter permease [Amycolatopsis acidicola]|uniref:ABC transporter permease n=2 Tax=Amycolatopsis acidicola TaxID=2596893 RepID=A0A5N0VEM0_9PSEU|nr:ABC transporter permease [Amycolatopsis acidicola]
MIIGAIVNPEFLTLANIFNNVLVTSAVLGLLVLAESLVLIGGQFDLSLESIVGLAPVIAVLVVAPASNGGLGLQLAPILGVLVAFVVSAAIGLFNGTMVAKLSLNAFIVTLAMQILLRGLSLGLSGGKTFSSLPPLFTFLGDTFFLGISAQVWLLLIAYLVAGLFLRFHATGRKIFAMGGNADAARAAGVHTARLTMGLFVTAGLLSGLAGLMLTSRIASVTADQGSGMIFTVFAAAVIGGISLDGGRGSMFGAFTGVLLLGIIQNILVLSSVPSFWINAIYGVIILAALIVGHVTGRGPFRRLAKRSAKTAGS